MPPQGLTELVVPEQCQLCLGRDKMAGISRGGRPHTVSLGMRRPAAGTPSVKVLGRLPGTTGDKGLWTWEDRVQYTELQASPKEGGDIKCALLENCAAPVWPNFNYIISLKEKLLKAN